MPSETPTDGRCNARVSDKVGLEIITDTENETTDEQLVLSDEQIVVVHLVSPDEMHVIEPIPNYVDLRQYLWDDYTPEFVAVDPVSTDLDRLAGHPAVNDVDADRPPIGADLPPGMTDELQHDELHEARKEALDSGDVAWIDFDTDQVRATNHGIDFQGYCLRYPMDSGTCYVHQQGKPAEPGNTLAMKSGLYAKRTNYWNALDDDEQAVVEMMVDGWLEDAPFTRDERVKVNELYRIAIDQHRLWGTLDENYVDEDGNQVGLTKEITVDYDEETGEEITTEDENPANLPYTRLSDGVYNRLKQLEITEDTDDTAEVEISLAQQLSGEDN
jgi:hypothetical protein